MFFRHPRTIIYLVAAFLISGCGFQLRNDYRLDDKFKQLQLIEREKNSALSLILQQRLKVFGVALTKPGMKQNDGNIVAEIPTIVLYPESLDRRLLSLFPSGQVAEYELIYTCRYEMIDTNGNSSFHEFEILREYQDDPDQVLAKSRELNIILNEMRKEASNRIIRQFSVEQL